MKTYTLEQMLEAVRKKYFTGRGVGTAAGYVQTVVDAADGDAAKGFRKLLKAAGDRLVFRGAGAKVEAFSKSVKGEVVTTGKSVRKDGGKLTAASVMDIENILTTKDRDRDGDVLHPKGAKLDPGMPLLWQHLPTDPIGKLVNVLDQSEDVVKTHYAIADVPLGRDAAVLVEFGALRFSHGFKPLKFAPLGEDEDGEPEGWDVTEYEVMEGSLVSVPANTGAVITAFSRQKLNSPLMKSWAGKLYDERPVLVKGGWQPPAIKNAAGGTVVVNVNVGDKSAAGSKAAGKDAKRCPTPKKDKPTNEGEQADSTGEDEKGKKGKPGDEKPATMLGDVAQRAAEMADDESLPKEVRARMGVVSGILTDVSEGIAGIGGKLSESVEKQDIAGIMGAQDELRAMCGKRLSRAAAELQTLSAMGEDEVPGDVKGGLGEMADAVAGVMSALGTADADVGETAATGTAPEDDSTGNGTDPDEEESGGGDGLEIPDQSEEDDEDEDEDAEKDEDDAETTDDDADDNDPFGDEDDAGEDTDLYGAGDGETADPRGGEGAGDDSDDDEEDEEDEKAEDDDEEDEDGDGPNAEKDDGVDDPDSEIDPDEENPGVGNGGGKGKPKKSAADAAGVLLGKMIGGESLDAGTRRALRELLAD